MVNLKGSIYKEIVDEIVRWNADLKYIPEFQLATHQ